MYEVPATKLALSVYGTALVFTTVILYNASFIINKCI